MRSDTSEEVARFDWVRGSNIQEAACLTFVRGKDIGMVAEAFGAVTTQHQQYDFDEFCEESFALQETYSVIGVRSLGDWVLVVEDNGRQGSRPEVLRRVSEATEVVSVLWDAQALTRFCYAVGGEVRTTFEAMLPEFRQGTEPDALEDTRSGLPWSDSDCWRRIAVLLALSARLTGDILTPEAFRGEFHTYPVAEWPDDLPSTSATLEDEVTHRFSAELVHELRNADDADRVRATARVSRLVLERVDWLDQPVIQDTLAALESGRGADTAAINTAIREWTWRLQVSRATSRERNQVRATEVLRQSTNSDSYLGVLAALHAGRLVSGIGTDDLAQAVLSAQWRT